MTMNKHTKVIFQSNRINKINRISNKNLRNNLRNRSKVAKIMEYKIIINLIKR